MTKTEQLDLLFKKWEEENPECIGKFVKDGIIDDEKYLSTHPKILFITKEPNNPKQKAGNFRSWWKEEVKYTFTYRIAEWSYGLIHDIPIYDDIRLEKESAKEALYRIAFMNVKKVGGSSVAEEHIINDYIKRHFSFIHNEIDIIEPEIVITGLSKESTKRYLFPDVKWINSGYNITIGRHRGMKIIEFYHPSCRIAAKTTYNLLQNVYRSPAFLSL